VTAPVERPLVSVIIPTRNRAHCLPRALDSVRGQEGRGELFDLEIVVVDDASSDATPAVIGRYPEVRGIRLTQQRGVSVAKNAALRASRGSFVAFLDDDDEWLSHKLRLQVPVLAARTEVGVVYSPFRLRAGGVEQLYPQPGRAPSGWIFPALLMENCCGGSLLIRRAAIDKAGHFDETLVSWEDYDLWLRIAHRFPYLFLPEPVALYSPAPQGLFFSSASDGSGARDRIRVTEKALRLLPATAEHAELRREAEARALLGTIWTLVTMGDLGRASSRVLTTLLARPSMLEYPWARNYLTVVTSAAFAAAPSPRHAVRTLRAELRSALRERSRSDRAGVRQVSGEVWATVASCLARDPRARPTRAIAAAARAFVHAPSRVRWRETLGLAARAALGPAMVRRIQWLRGGLGRLR
jgi:hypothetical protein